MKVLIVEDLEVNATYLSSLLGVHGIESEIAETGEMALDLVQRVESIYSSIGCILLDIGLPDIDGIEVCEILKSNIHTQNIPIIFLTAYKDEEYLIKAFDAGAIDYIVKPYTDIDVIPRVKAHLQNFKLLTETLEMNAQLNSSYEEMRQITDILNEQNEQIEQKSEKLALEEEKYRQLTEHLHEIVWKTDLDGNFTYLNSAFTKVFGIEIEPGIYPCINDIFINYTVDDIKNIVNEELIKFNSSMRDDNPIFIELEGKHKNGDSLFLESSAEFILDDDDKPIAIHGIIRNISERKKNELEIQEYKTELEVKVQKRTEELEKSKKHLRLVFDHAPVIMLLLDNEYKIVDINDTGFKLLGENSQQLLGRRFGVAFGCVYVYENKGVCGIAEECSNCGIFEIIYKTIDLEKEQSKIETQIEIFAHKSIELRTVNISTTIISEIDEFSILVTIDDITEQKKMQEKLLESEEKYRKLFETKNEAVFFLDAETMKYVDANDAACDLYGYTYDEILQLGPLDISLDIDDTNCILKLLIEKKEKLSVRNRYCKRKDGSEIIVEIQNTVFHFKGRKTIFSTHRNITQRHRALQALKESENTFRTLVENIDDVFWVVNSDLKQVTYISPRIEQVTSYSEEYFLNTNEFFLKFIHPADKEKFVKLVPDLLSGKKISVELRSLSGNNQIKWLYLRSFGNYYLGKGESIFGLLSDITEKKLTERRVLKAVLETESREREIFAKELHDGLGANLSSIKMLLERLNSKEITSEKREFYSKHALDIIMEAVIISKEISNNLKPHTLVNHGLIPSIETLCENINKLGGLQVLFELKKTKITLDNETKLAIYRILNELINNSLKYSKAEQAKVSLAEKNGRILLQYSDNGKGFDIEEAIRANGSGLKNIIARVELLGGSVDFESKINNGMKTKISFLS